MSELAWIDTGERDGIAVARVSGEIDASNAEAKGVELAAAVGQGSRGLVVDLSGVRFIDSSGIGVLFGLARRLEGRRQMFAIAIPAAAPVRRALEIVHFDRAAPVYETVEDALAASAAVTDNSRGA